jgi:hypothetical protein
LILQSAAVQIFMQPRNVHLFRDFTYEHATKTTNPAYGATEALPECIVFGGMAMGYDDPSSAAEKAAIVSKYMKDMCKYPCIRKQAHAGREFFTVSTTPVGVEHFHCDEWPQPSYCVEHPECEAIKARYPKWRCEHGCAPPYNAFNLTRPKWEAHTTRYMAQPMGRPNQGREGRPSL